MSPLQMRMRFARWNSICGVEVHQRTCIQSCHCIEIRHPGFAVSTNSKYEMRVWPSECMMGMCHCDLTNRQHARCALYSMAFHSEFHRQPIQNMHQNPRWHQRSVHFSASIAVIRVLKTPNDQEILAPKGCDEKETTFSFSTSGRNRNALKMVPRGILQNVSAIALAIDDPDICVQWTWSIAHSFYT